MANFQQIPLCGLVAILALKLMSCVRCHNTSPPCHSIDSDVDQEHEHELLYDVMLLQISMEPMLSNQEKRIFTPQMIASQDAKKHLHINASEALNKTSATPSISALSSAQVTSVSDGPEQCMSTDFDALLKGLETDSEEDVGTLPWVSLFGMLTLGIIMLMFGHRLVTLVVASTSFLAGFFLTFELFLKVTTSCSLPVSAGVFVGLAVGGLALFFLELAIVVPGAVFGAILAYQVGEIFQVVSPSFWESAGMVDYFWIIAVFTALLFAYIAHILREDIFITVTSALGAYAFEIALRGILIEYVPYHMPPMVAFTCMVVAFILGLFVQNNSLQRK